MSNHNSPSAAMAKEVSLTIRELVNPLKNMLREAHRVLNQPDMNNESKTSHGFGH